MTKLHDEVVEFHNMKHQPVNTSPVIPDKATVRLRPRLVLEEAFELAEATYPTLSNMLRSTRERVLKLMSSVDPTPDVAKIADACADLDYVVEGTRVAYGIDGEPIARAVHAANMAKASGGVDDHGKAKKPEGWQPPDVLGLLIAQGWVEPIPDDEVPLEPEPDRPSNATTPFMGTPSLQIRRDS